MGKKKWSAKAAAVLAAGVVGCFLVTACQPTPREEVVVNKISGDFEQKAQETPSPAPTDRPAAEPAETWVEEIQLGDALTVNINADIHMPDSSAIPVVKVKNRSFSQAEIDNLVQYFSNGGRVQGADPQLTKSECEEMIVALKQEMAQWESFDSLTEEEKNVIDNGASAEDNIAALREQIAAYEKMYETAPESHESAGISFDIQNIPGDKVLSASVTLERPNPAALILGKNPENADIACSTFAFMNYESAYLDWEGISREKEEELKQSMSVSEEDAEKTARTVLTGLGLNEGDFSVSKAVARPQNIAGEESAYFELTFAKKIRGVPLTNFLRAAETQTDGDIPAELLYAPGVRYEALTIQVDSTGVIGFQWVDPIETVEVVNETVKIISLEEAKESFRKNISLKNWAIPGTGDKTVIEIEDVFLNLMLIREQDNRENLIAAPAWDFIGFKSQSDQNGGLPEQNDLLGQGVSFLTVNAVDGSVVNRDIGY